MANLLTAHRFGLVWVCVCITAVIVLAVVGLSFVYLRPISFAILGLLIGMSLTLAFAPGGSKGRRKPALKQATASALDTHLAALRQRRATESGEQSPPGRRAA